MTQGCSLDARTDFPSCFMPLNRKSIRAQCWEKNQSHRPSGDDVWVKSSYDFVIARQVLQMYSWSLVTLHWLHLRLHWLWCWALWSPALSCRLCRINPKLGTCEGQGANFHQWSYLRPTTDQQETRCHLQVTSICVWPDIQREHTLWCVQCSVIGGV